MVEEEDQNLNYRQNQPVPGECDKLPPLDILTDILSPRNQKQC